jgi:hypothetical protein
MKVAVCFYGYPRNYSLGKKSFDHFLEDIEHDFFIHAWCEDNITTQDYTKTYQDIKNLFEPKEFVLERQKKFKNSFDFECDLSAVKKDFVDQGIAISVTLSPLYSIMRVGELLENFNSDYDLVILTRVDVLSLDKLKNYKFDSLSDIYSSHCHGDIWKLNENGEAIDTKMILSDEKNIIYFTKIFNKTEEYLKNDNIRLCHHRLFAHHLRKLNKKFHMIFDSSNNWYYIRENGHLEGELAHNNIKNLRIFQ